MYRFAIAFTLFIIAAANPCYAQFSKGMRMPGVTVGSVFFNSGKIEYSSPPPTAGYTSNTNSLGVNLVPSLGWFITDNTVIGGRIASGYKYNKYIDAANNVTFRKKEEKILTIGLGVFARNYFKTTGSLIPFAQVNLDAGIGSSDTEGFSYTSTSKEIYEGKSSGDFFANAGIAAGVTKMLSAHIGLDLTAGYTFSYSKNRFKVNSETDTDLDGVYDTEGINDLTTKSTNHGFTIGLGLQVFLSKRK